MDKRIPQKIKGQGKAFQLKYLNKTSFICHGSDMSHIVFEMFITIFDASSLETRAREQQANLFKGPKMTATIFFKAV